MTDDDQIRDLHALWAQCEADNDGDAWSALYVPDGKYIRPRGQECIGKAALAEHINSRLVRYPKARHTTHVLGPAVIRVNGDTAETTNEYVAYGRVAQDAPWGILAVGRLHNHLLRKDGRWFFTEVANHAYFFGDPPPDRLPGLPRL